MPYEHVPFTAPDGLWPRLTQRWAFFWYFGCLFGLANQVSVIAAMWKQHDLSLLLRSVTTMLMVIFALAFLTSVPLLKSSTIKRQVLFLAIFLGVTFLFYPALNENFLWMWVFVACAAGMLLSSFLLAIAVVATLVLTQVVIIVWTGGTNPSGFELVVITASMGIFMVSFNTQLLTVLKLRAAQSEIARLAVVEERSRFSRDLHDILGHSLTVLTVKTELASRLVRSDPQRAESELADIERLARASLTDLRAAVAGYRPISFGTELAAAEAALTAAGCAVVLPRDVSCVGPELSELFGWVLREGITNVLRHSGAQSCWVSVGPQWLRIEDDGRGVGQVSRRRVDDPGVSGAPTGNGLNGLRERSNSLGMVVTLSDRQGGGSVLTLEPDATAVPGWPHGDRDFSLMETR